MIKNAWSWLADDPRHRVGVRVLQVAIGAMLMFRVLTELPFAAYLWGPHGIGLSGNPSYFGPWLAGKLDVIFHSMAGTYAVLGAVALAAVGLVSGRHTRAATVLALFATLMLERRLPEVLDGGDNITRLTLTYMLFLLPADAKPVRRSLGVWVHNIAVVAIMAQLVVLYATSGIMKAAGERWHHGTALYVVSQVEWFSVPWVRSIFKNPFMTTIATYSTLLFQLWFPMAIFSRFKLVWLAAGIFFHLNIAIVMGLVTFSTVMIGLELFLITDEEFASLQAAGRRIVAGALERLGLGRVAEPQILLYIDGHCAHCRRAGEALRRLDRGGQLTIRSFRHHADYARFGISADALERRMHAVILATGEVARGFGAVQALARTMPLLWPARPLLWLIDRAGLGERAYDWLAARRTIVPDARACSDGACALPVAADEAREREVA
ncbi:MAG TPA: DCC1-like thiol-disulfide oxidoreductase family protein [Polyangia bacterium]|nr:DCC1-like thiol-disulfide oxidoreductase family protein [Polyangia bacterium]